MHLPSLLAQQGPSGAVFFVVLISFVAILVFLLIFARYFGLWIQSFMTRAGISFPNLVMMSFRKVNPSVIVRCKIMAVQAGLTKVYPISTRALEAHYLAQGN